MVSIASDILWTLVVVVSAGGIAIDIRFLFAAALPWTVVLSTVH